MCDSVLLKRAQVNNLIDAAVVTLKSKFPGAIVARSERFVTHDTLLKT
jgi:hypothetical protein